MITLEEAIDARIRLAIRAERQRIILELRAAADREFDYDSNDNTEAEILNLVADSLST